MKTLNEMKIELLKKIINAKLTKEEMQAVKEKAEEIIDRRPTTEEESESTEMQELDKDIFDIADDLTLLTVDLENAQTLVCECMNDLQDDIKGNGSKEDKELIKRLINRRPVLYTFLSLTCGIVAESINAISQASQDLILIDRGY